MTRVIVLIFLVGGLVALSVSWGGGEKRADLVTAYMSIETLDAQRSRAHDDIEAAYCLFEGLATFEPEHFNIVPGIAERWDVSDDGLVYTFHLREGSGWTDGTPVTAWDFRYAWHLGMLPDTSAYYVEFLMLVKGAKAYFDWGSASSSAIVASDATPTAKMAMARQRRQSAIDKFDELVGVRVLDDHTIEVELERPVAYFDEIVSTWVYFPLHKPTIEAATSIDPTSYQLTRDNQWTKPGRMVSNGPYRLADWRFKRAIRFERNPHYWNQEAIGPDTVEMRNFQDHNTAFIAYESGEVDFYPQATPVSFSPELMEKMRSGERDDVHPVTAFGVYYYVINCRPKLPDGRDNPFTDVRLRKALALSVDRTQIVERVTRMYEPTMDVFVPRDVISGYESPTGMGYDPDEARRLLAEAGYPRGRGLTVDMLYNTSGGHEQRAQAIARMWEEELGVEVELAGEEWKVFVDSRNRGQYMIGRSGWFGDYTDPTTFLDLFVSTNGNNDSGISDPVYDEMMREAATITDRQERLALLSKAEEYLVNEMVPMVALHQYVMFDLGRPDEFDGLKTSARNMHQFYRLRRLRPAE